MRKPGELVPKDPDSDEPQGFDWSAYLAELGAGTIIVESTWTITGLDAALTYHDSTILAGVKTQAYFNLGTPGGRYVVTNRIVTNNAPPVRDERHFKFLVQNR
jgi:hypothetical protein